MTAAWGGCGPGWSGVVSSCLLSVLPLEPDLPLHPFHPQFRNPKASLRVRLCDLLGHLQRSGERDCQEFYRALYIHAQPLHGRLPSRLGPRKCARPLRQGRLRGGPQREQGVFHMQRSLSVSVGPVFTQQVASGARGPALLSSLAHRESLGLCWRRLTAVPGLSHLCPHGEAEVAPTPEDARGDPCSVGVFVEQTRAQMAGPRHVRLA